MRLILFSILFLSTLISTAQAPFITTWKTDNPGSSNNQSITIPTTGSGYSYDVDWESDGIYDDIGVTGSITHEYTAKGTYTVSIRGSFPRIYFNDSGDRRKILSIEKWGDIIWGSMANAFFGASNLKLNTIEAPNLNQVADLSGMFRNVSNLNTSLDDWDVSTITDMSWLFSGATSFSGPIEDWEVHNVLDMTSMFEGASSFSGQLDMWQVQNVTSMSSMFENASSFNGDISGWTTVMLANTSSMFLGASSFNQILSLWDISNVSSMSFMLNSSGLSQENYDKTLIGWSNQTVQPNVILGAGGLFYCLGENARSTLEHTFNWNISGDSRVCYFKTTWQTNNPGPSNNSSITIPVSVVESYNYDVDWDNDGVFDESNIKKTITHNYGTPGIYEVTIRGDFPRIHFNNSGDKDKLISIDQWGDQEWTSMENAFYGCNNLQYNAPDAPILSAVTSLTGIFRNCTNVNANLNDWNISGITDMKNAFDHTSMSVANYDSTLFAWASRIHLPNVGIGAIGLEYCLSEFVRDDLMNDGWTFIGDSKNCTGIVRPMVITVQTDLPGSTSDFRFKLPIFQLIGQVDYDVDWNNDGIYEDLNNGLSTIHNFPSPGTYRIAIAGDFPRIYFNNEDDAQKIISIDQWGDQTWASMENAFHGCTNLQLNATDIPDLSEVESMNSMFNDAYSLNADLNSWDVSNVQSMQSLFSGAEAFNADLSSWNVGDVSNMVRMFQGADAFNQNLGGWNISSVTNMFNMLTSTNLSFDNYDNTLIGWASQTVNSGVPLGAGDLQYCAGEAARDLLISTYNWNISGDSRGCDYFITTWKTDNPGTSNSTSITIPTADFSGDYNYDVDWNNDGIFEDNGVTGDITHDYGSAGIYTVAIRGNFPHLYLNGEGDRQKIISLDQWGNIQWHSFSRAFEGASNMLYAAVDTPRLNSVSFMSGAFKDATLFDGDLRGWDLSQVQQMVSLFENAISFNGDISDWKFNKAFNMTNMFKGATSFNQDIGSWDLDTMRHMNSMFEGATSFNQDIGDWDVADVETMSGMFQGATSFNQDIGNWDVSKVEIMFEMFKGASAFNQDLNLWDVENVDNMGAMFRDANSFNGNISEWKVNNVSSMSSMFRNASSFNQDISSWIPNSVSSMSFMFRNATSFNQNLGDWIITSVTDMNEMLSFSGLSISNYDSTLIGWSNQMIQPNVSVIASTLEFCDGENARDDLIMNNGWTFFGDSKNCTIPCGQTVNTWIGPITGNWNANASNWSEGGIPDMCHRVVIPNGKSVTLLTNQSGVCYLIEVQDGGELIIENGSSFTTE